MSLKIICRTFFLKSHNPSHKPSNTCYWDVQNVKWFIPICKTFLKLKAMILVIIADYNASNAPAFSSRNIKSVRYWLQTISYMAPKIWDLVPKERNKLLIWLNSRPKSKSGCYKTVLVDSIKLTFHR